MNLTDVALLHLRRRKARAGLIILGLASGVACVVALVSLTDLLTADINHKLEKYGANILITPRTEALALNYGGLQVGGFSYEMAEIGQADLDRIWRIKNKANLAAVSPMVLGLVKIKGRPVLLNGFDFKTAPVIKPWWEVAGRSPQGDEILLGAQAAQVLGLKAGDRVDLNGRKVAVAGILSPTGSQDDQIAFTPLATAQAVLGKPGRISLAEVAALCHNCPIDEMVAQISAALPQAKVVAIRQVVEGRLNTIAHLGRFSLGLGGLVVLVGGLVVLTTMLSAVKERTQEIGVFRAVGFRQGHIARIVLIEAGLVSALAGLLGYLAGLGAARLMLPWFSGSQHPVWHWDPLLAGLALGLAVTVGLLASLYPAVQAARLDPVAALRSY